MIQELDRIVEETNAELEQVQDDITDAIDEHNTDTEATHLDIRQEIADLENDLQEQIDGIDDTLESHESRIGELEQFAETLETNITEEIEDALENKADLVDGKVPLEQLPVELSTDIDLTEYAKKTDIPDIIVNNGDAESGKYISQIAVDATDKHKLIVTKADLPQGFSGNYNDLTNKPTIPTVPTISTNITTDALDDTKTASPKAVKTYVDNAISTALDSLLGGEY
jgi:predicted phage tail protein